MTCFRAWCAGTLAAGIQSDYMSEQCMTFLVDYVSNVWQAGSVHYADVLHVILPPDTQYLTLASHMKRLQPASVIRQQGPCVCTVQQNLKNAGLVKSQLGVQTQSLLSPTTLH